MAACPAIQEALVDIRKKLVEAKKDDDATANTMLGSPSKRQRIATSSAMDADAGGQGASPEAPELGASILKHAAGKRAETYVLVEVPLSAGIKAMSDIIMETGSFKNFQGRWKHSHRFFVLDASQLGEGPKPWKRPVTARPLISAPRLAAGGGLL